MLKTQLPLLVSVLLIVTHACVPGFSTPDAGAINTAIAQTRSALHTQTAHMGIPITGGETPTLSLTPSPLPTATQSPVATLSPIPIIVTPVVPLITVSVPTNCRVGPGIPYRRVGGLRVGEAAAVVGRNAARNYWIIENPDRSGVCWLWGRYANVSGDTTLLPVFTPPPPPTNTPTPVPTPALTVSYQGLEVCTGRGWWVDFILENSGGISFQSISLNVRDTTNNTVVSLFADRFTNLDGCSDSIAVGTLSPGETWVVSSSAFTYNPSGHNLRATITLCSSPGQSGTCVTRSIAITP